MRSYDQPTGWIGGRMLPLRRLLQLKGGSLVQA